MANAHPRVAAVAESIAGPVMGEANQKAMTGAREEHEPNAERHALYRDYYAVYREAYRGLVPAYSLLNEIERKEDQNATGP